MNYNEAVETKKMFEKIGGFTKIEIEHFGFWCTHTPEIDNDGKWEVHLRSTNAKAGNRNLRIVKAKPSDEQQAEIIARVAKNIATQRDRDALLRIEIERAI